LTWHVRDCILAGKWANQANEVEMSRTHEITGMLKKWSDGNEKALEDLLPMVYDELHKQAARYLRRERRNHTLQPTALINEAYVKLIDQRNLKWESRTHFFAIAASLMRRILVDHARARHRKKTRRNKVGIAIE